MCLTFQERCHVPLSAHDIACSRLICNPGEVSGGDERVRRQLQWGQKRESDKSSRMGSDQKMMQTKKKKNRQNTITAGNVSRTGLESMRMVWSFWNNNRLERLNRHSGSFCSTQPPVHSHQHRLRPSVWLPQSDRAWRDGDKRERVRAAQLVMGWKTIWAKSFCCVIGAVREFVVTALHLLANAKDDGPLMSFTVIQLS